MKRLTNVIAIILLLGLAAIVFILFSFHPDQHQQQLRQWASQQGVELRYGHSDWSLLSPFHWTLHAVQLSQKTQFKLTAAQISLDVWPLPLFEGRLEFKQIQIDAGRLQATPALFKTRSRRTLVQQPLIKSILIDQLLLNEFSLDWQDEFGHIQVNGMRLALEQWQLYANNSASPQSWQLKLIASADVLELPDVNVRAPQVRLVWQNQRLELKHLSGELLGGTFYGAGYWQEQRLVLSQLTLDGTRIETFNPSPSPQNPASQSQLPTPPPWIDEVRINQLLVNQVSLVGQWQTHSWDINQLSGNANQLSWKAGQFGGYWSATSNDLRADQLLLGDVSASGGFIGQGVELDRLSASFLEGLVTLRGYYQWAPKKRLVIQQLNLDDNVFAIQPSWLIHLNEATDTPPLESVELQHLDVHNAKLLSYIERLPLAAEGINLSVAQLMPIRERRWQPLPQLWTPQTQLFLEAPELAYKGVILSHLNAEVNSENQQGSFSVYGELPLGQLEVSGTAQLDHPMRPWQAKASGLFLDLSSLARLTGDPSFMFGGDLNIASELSGELTQGLASVSGQLQLTSTQLAVNRELQKPMQQWLKDPAQALPSYQDSLAVGAASLWKSGQFGVGETLWENLTLNLTVTNGMAQPKETIITRDPQTWRLSGALDLAQQRYQHWALSLIEDNCEVFSRRLDGPWSAPSIEVSVRGEAQSYWPLENRFDQQSTPTECLTSASQ
jgi:hypothetical protein